MTAGLLRLPTMATQRRLFVRRCINGAFRIISRSKSGANYIHNAWHVGLYE
jgi:hypothetical protein